MSSSTKNMLRVSIESQKFPGSFLRMDGKDVKEYTGSGSGVVNVQNHVASYETFIIVNHPEEKNISIMSAQFPNVFLRLDGTHVQSGEEYASGAGTVNCQWGSHSYEKFRLEDQEDGSKAIASVKFPNVYLRLENVSGQGGPSGAGTVNCQTYVGSYEKFKIRVL
ncbi:hypothetical protein BDV25DRAFT_136105 [Aspergillus avenaceus]|uniref:Uncharacterized protein n=1 Tax=Aspergillus avenaceus TaxID=36643 RepID=A0A5N6U6Z0_ASPAV|nr:hypothetical protein BDV25DRAFT_136105 [Aspergillus avenaceus]